jgi:hypothetical protein
VIYVKSYKLSEPVFEYQAPDYRGAEIVTKGEDSESSQEPLKEYATYEAEKVMGKDYKEDRYVSKATALSFYD